MRRRTCFDSFAPWHWVFGDLTDEAAEPLLRALLGGEDIGVGDRHEFLNLLAWSPSLGLGEKAKVLLRYPTLSIFERQIFTDIFRDERDEFALLLDKHAETVVGSVFRAATEWPQLLWASAPRSTPIDARDAGSVRRVIGRAKAEGMSLEDLRRLVAKADADAEIIRCSDDERDLIVAQRNPNVVESLWSDVAGGIPAGAGDFVTVGRPDTQPLAQVIRGRLELAANALVQTRLLAANVSGVRHLMVGLESEPAFWQHVRRWQSGGNAPLSYMAERHLLALAPVAEKHVRAVRAALAAGRESEANELMDAGLRIADRTGRCDDVSELKLAKAEALLASTATQDALDGAGEIANEIAGGAQELVDRSDAELQAFATQLAETELQIGRWSSAFPVELEELLSVGRMLEELRAIVRLIDPLLTRAGLLCGTAEALLITGQREEAAGVLEKAEYLSRGVGLSMPAIIEAARRIGRLDAEGTHYAKFLRSIRRRFLALADLDIHRALLRMAVRGPSAESRADAADSLLDPVMRIARLEAGSDSQWLRHGRAFLHPCVARQNWVRRAGGRWDTRADHFVDRLVVDANLSDPQFERRLLAIVLALIVGREIATKEARERFAVRLLTRLREQHLIAPRQLAAAFVGSLARSTLGRQGEVRGELVQLGVGLLDADPELVEDFSRTDQSADWPEPVPLDYALGRRRRTDTLGNGQERETDYLDEAKRAFPVSRLQARRFWIYAQAVDHTLLRLPVLGWAMDSVALMSGFPNSRDLVIAPADFGRGQERRAEIPSEGEGASPHSEEQPSAPARAKKRGRKTKAPNADGMAGTRKRGE